MSTKYNQITNNEWNPASFDSKMTEPVVWYPNMWLSHERHLGHVFITLYAHVNEEPQTVQFLHTTILITLILEQRRVNLIFSNLEITKISKLTCRHRGRYLFHYLHRIHTEVPPNDTKLCSPRKILTKTMLITKQKGFTLKLRYLSTLTCDRRVLQPKGQFAPA